MPAPTTASFDFNPLQSQRLSNGNTRNGSPAFNNPIYHTQAVIPSKRPRPRGDSLGASPRQNPGILPASRSQTPQQLPYPGYQGAVNGGQQFQGPTPYQHLQHAGTSASISPVIQNQTFTPQVGTQRLQTTSPSPFSPGVQNFASQASPAHSEHGSRVNTPQNGGQPYAQVMPYAVGPNQPFSPPLGPSSTGPPTPQYIQNPQTPQNIERQRLHEMRMRQINANSLASQHRNQGGPPIPPPNPSGQVPTAYQIGLARTPQAHQVSRPNNPEQFVRSIAQWMQQRGFPLNPNPTVLGRPLPLMQLFGMVVKLGGSKKITDTAQWPDVAKMLQVPPAQVMTAAHELQSYWHNNLSAYESSWLQSRQRIVNEQARGSHILHGGEIPTAHGQFSPVRQTEPHLLDPQRQQFLHHQPPLQAEYQTPPKRINHQQHGSFPLKQNGYTTSQQGQVQGGPSNFYNLSQSGAPLPPRARTQPNSRSGTALKREPNSGVVTSSARRSVNANWPRRAPEEVGEVFKPKIEPLKREEISQSHGGMQALDWKVVIDELLDAKPDVPGIQELGVIDIRALTMSLRSGIHAEVRLALDTLATLSKELEPSLEECEDLVEVLIECAEDQVELLAENAAEVSDAMLISSYEEIVRGCRVEVESLQEVHEFGSLECELDRSVERLICITTILRNLSFSEVNHRLLADPIVVRFMTTVIRYLGTRNMLLRTYRNTLDFTKDVVIYLSNLTQDLNLPGKEEALCFLHFLLSFAPSPPPTTNGDEDVTFAPYNPTIHRYFPPAVDSLAKLLARDDPNRTFYRAIFLADSGTVPPHDLLTRTFGLAVAPMPEYRTNVLHTVEARKAYLAQGLLAAEILAGLIPNSEHALARSWLSSQDGFALNLIKIVSSLSKSVSQVPQRHPSGRMMEPDPHGYGMITFRGLAVLRKLAEKAKDVEGHVNELPPGILPKKESLLGSLLTANMDVNVVRQLCSYSGLES